MDWTEKPLLVFLAKEIYDYSSCYVKMVWRRRPREEGGKLVKNFISTGQTRDVAIHWGGASGEKFVNVTYILKGELARQMKWKQNQDIHGLSDHVSIFWECLLYLRWGFMTVPIIFLTVCASHTQRLRSTAMVCPLRLCKWTCCLTGSKICHKSFTPILVVTCCYLKQTF